MIKVIKNKSFSEYYEIYDDSTRLEEVQGKLKAKRVAMKLAKKLKQTFFLFLGESVNVEWTKEINKNLLDSLRCSKMLKYMNRH